MDKMDKLMEMLDEVQSGFLKHRDFESRTGRWEFWCFIGFVVLVSLFTSSLDGLFFGYDRVFGPLNILSSLVLIMPTCAVTTRRLHDVNKSGRWQVLPIVTLVVFIALGIFAKMNPAMDLGFIPMISGAVMLISFGLLIRLCLINGDPTANQFGAVPEIKVKEMEAKPETYIYRPQ